MIKHWRYLKYIIRHKWFVLVASWKIGAPIWNAIVHDLSKFRPSEWFPYAHYFFEADHDIKFCDEAFDRAWLLHQRRNPHHWQYWILREDDGLVKTIQMPDKYVREMVADWAGAGRAITGKWDISEWYEKNKEKIRLHPTTCIHVLEYLGRF